jgi:DNA-binding XRE family transcriptional regulator
MDSDEIGEGDLSAPIVATCDHCGRVKPSVMQRSDKNHGGKLCHACCSELPGREWMRASAYRDPEESTMAYRLDGLKAQREAQGMTQDQLAAAAIVSVFRLVQIEAGGDVDPEVAQRLANALSTDLAGLGAAEL